MSTPPQSRQHAVVDRVDWSRIFILGRLTRAMGLSCQPARLLLGLAVIVILMLSGSIWDTIAGPSVSPHGLSAIFSAQDSTDTTNSLNMILSEKSIVDSSLRPMTMTPQTVREAVIATYAGLDSAARADRYQQFRQTLDLISQTEPIGVFEAAVRYLRGECSGIVSSAVTLNITGVFSHLVNVVVQLPRLLWVDHKWFVMLFGAWAALVCLVGGCAVSRSAACEFAVEQNLEWTRALAFALKRWIPLAGTVALPGLVVVVGLILLGLGGLLFKAPVLDIAGGILYVMALFGGFVAACVIILTALGCGNFIPAIAVESADAPDALARAFSYVRNRPLHWLLYNILAIIQGVVGLIIVTILAAVTINFTSAGANLFLSSVLSTVSGHATLTSLLPDHDAILLLTGTSRWAGEIIYLWRTMIAGLVAGWVVSYGACAMTVVYFLLRKATDDEEITEIWQPGMIEATMAPERVGNAQSVSD